ncbi:hypothetical protein YC2023_072709 [Brassica napus]
MELPQSPWPQKMNITQQLHREGQHHKRRGKLISGMRSLLEPTITQKHLQFRILESMQSVSVAQSHNETALLEQLVTHTNLKPYQIGYAQHPHAASTGYALQPHSQTVGFTTAYNQTS